MAADTPWWAYIQRLMLERGWGPTELSRQIGRNRAIVSAWSTGSIPDLKTLRGLAGRLEVSVVELLIATSYFGPEDFGAIELRPDPTKLSNEELLHEVGRRLGGTSPAPGDGEWDDNYSGDVVHGSSHPGHESEGLHRTGRSRPRAVADADA